MLIQVNKSLNVNLINEDLSKSELADKFNKTRYWSCQDITLNQLAVYINEGASIRPGISTKSCRVKDIEKMEVMIFDVDGKVTLKEALMADKKNYIDIVKPSYSYTEDNQKFHLVCVLSEVITDVNLYQKIYKTLLSEYFTFADPACSSAHQFFYGTTKNNTGKIRIMDFYEKIDVAMKLIDVDVVESKPVKSGEIVDYTQSVSEVENPTKYSYQEYLRDNLSDVINNPNELFFLHDHKFEKTAIDKKDLTAKYQGSNPFSPTNSSGTSFVVSYKEGELLPYWYDRSRNADTKNHGGNFVEYVKQSYKQIYNQEIGFKQAVNIITEHFGLPEYNFQNELLSDDEFSKYCQDSKELLTKYFLEYAKGRIYGMEDSWNTKVNEYFYMQDSYSWVVGNASKFICQFINKLDDIDSNLVPKSIKIKFKFYDFIQGFCSKLLMYNIIKKDSAPIENDRYVGFSNGYFDVEKKEFVGFVPDVYNLKAYKFPYYHISDISAQKYLDDWRHYCDLSYSDNSYNADLYYYWSLLNVLGIAYRTENHVGLTGTAGSGKTTNLEMLQVLVDIKGINTTANIFLEDNQFGNWHIEGAKSLFVNEFDGHAKYLKGMNRITGTGDYQIVTVEPKGRKSYQIRAFWSITTTTEGDIGINSGQNGAMRRYTFIEHSDKTKLSGAKKKEIIGIKRKIKPKSNQAYSDFLSNLITAIHRLIDIDELLEKWSMLANSKEQQRIKQRISQSNSKYGEFIENNLSITNEAEDFVTIEELNFMVDNYNAGLPNKIDHISIKTTRMNYLKKDLENLFDWKFSGQETRKKFPNGNTTTIYKGLKSLVDTKRPSDKNDDDF